jgi:DNA-directed RNA polymerase specialized sigma24 family protein
MTDQFDQSVSMWIRDLKQGDETAAARLWDRYFERLVKVASRKLGNAARRIADEEDVAVSVFNGLCQGAAAGRFDQLQNRADLWSLMVAIAGRKAVDQIRRQTSRKRGGTNLRGESIFQGAVDGNAGFDGFLKDEPTPEFLAVVEEENLRLLNLLRDDTQRQIAQLRMAGHSNEENAETVGISLRSVVRKLGIIKEVWSAELPDA